MATEELAQIETALDRAVAARKATVERTARLIERTETFVERDTGGT